MPLDGAFTALLLLISGVSAVNVAVLPPTNVTVSCQNLKVTVSWEYSKQQPETSFRVYIGGSDGNHVSETTDHQYDLSHFVWASAERYMGFHFVNVTAIQGGILSVPVESKSFSFNDLKTTDIKCELNFPPVDLNVKDSMATVSFINPLHYYSELKQIIQPDEASFRFHISLDGKDYEDYCTVKQENCKHDFSIPEDVEECVTMTGLLFSGNGAEQVLFNKMDNICPSNSTEVHIWITLIILLCAIALVIAVVILIVYKTRAWTLKTPNVLDPELQNRREEKPQYYTPSGTPISPVTLLDNKPCKRASVSSDDEDLQDLQDSSSDSDSQPPASAYMERRLSESSNQEPEAEPLIPARPRTEEDSADDSVKTECVWIDEEVEEEEEEEEEEVVEVSAYDRRQNLEVEIADGEMVTAYSWR